MAGAPLSLDDAGLLVDLADAAIVDGLFGNPPVPPGLAGLPPALHRPAGVFVTLMVAGDLNGCIGNVVAGEPMAVVTARHAWTAAFGDPRLPPLRSRDYGELEIEVSVLSPPTPVDAGSRPELLSRLRPHVDGLLVAAGRRQGVFLPAVWDKLPDPEDFLDHLLAKAGLFPGASPRGLRASRFTVEKFWRGAGQPGAPARAA